ncbi:hypothetical protein [Saccharothrix obliqua]|uniref:hypothetical protein n=1 Tax=Saccharothrix obliqua TaxID=2861747 RepID=UPI001C5DB397|nr:hypothetical protein [Saccharothrix obliqua]MBW4717122.1 hypothetical protein [Saccharothrix obliqua]
MRARGDERVAAEGSDRRTTAPRRALTPSALHRLQQAAGNRATAQRLAGDVRGGTRLGALEADVAAKRKAVTHHPTAAAEAGAAHAAAKPPPDDREALGKAAQAERMHAARPGAFDQAAFVRAVREAIAARAPKNLDEADRFGDSGRADAVRDTVRGQVAVHGKAAAGPVERTTAAPPEPVAGKPVTPLRPDAPPPAPAPPDPAMATPDPAPPGAVALPTGAVDRRMADAHVTDDLLANSGEPEFTDALADKRTSERHAATAPGEVRAAERRTLRDTRTAAAETGAAAMAAFAAERTRAGADVTTGKRDARGRHEAGRARVTATLQNVFDATKKDVEDVLTGLDAKVDAEFTTGEKAVRDAFTADHKRRMAAYKDKRYSGLLGAGRWLKDKFAGLPAEAGRIFDTAREGYVSGMRRVISDVAELIGVELNHAKQRIATGRARMAEAVRSLAPELRSIGREAAAGFAQRFDGLAESVDAKGAELVQTLATRYRDALKSADDEIAAAQAENRGLVAKAVAAVGAVVDTVLRLKELLLGVLGRAATAAAAIIRDPIGFLGRLVGAVGAGLRSFLGNIATHLRKGLLGWLLGALASTGLRLPARFDLRGVLDLVASVLGLTWAAIRGRVVARGVPDQAVTAAEESVPLVRKVREEGVSGLWEEVGEQVGDLRERLFGKITEYLVPTVLVAGVTWLFSLLNPASAFVKAVKMIIDLVTFVVERGAQLAEFAHAVLDAVTAIAAGGTGGVPALIENALARSVPVLIGALAAILGIGGIAEKVRGFVRSLSEPVLKVVDRVVDRVVGPAKRLWAKARGGRAGAGGPGAASGTRSFAMAGRPHTLTADLRGGRLRVVMASTPGALLAKAEAARRSSDEAHRPEVAAALAAFTAEHEPKMRAIEASGRSADNKQRELDLLLRDMAADLVAIGTRFRLQDLGSYAALGLGEIELNRVVHDALGIARNRVLGSRAATAGTEPKDDDGLKQRFERLMHNASSAYRRAGGATIGAGEDVHRFRGNTFRFAGATYFVDHQHNYIVPDQRVGPNRGALDGRVFVSSRPVVPSRAALDGDPARGLLEEFAYTTHQHSGRRFAELARLAAYGGTVEPNAGTMLLAALVAEAERNPNAHITNLLLLEEGADRRFYDDAPMTRGGSDNPVARRDRTLADLGSVVRLPPAEVTDAEIALVRRRFEAREGMSLAEVVAHLGADTTKRDLVEFLVRAAERL